MGDNKINLERKYDDPKIVARSLADIIVNDGSVGRDHILSAASRLPPGSSTGEVLADARRNAARTLRLFRTTYGQFPVNDRRLDRHRAYIRSRLPVYRLPSIPLIIRAVRSVRQFFADLERSTRPQ